MLKFRGENDLQYHFFRETLSNGNDSTNEPKKLSTPVSIGHYSGNIFEEVSSALFNVSDRSLIKPLNESSTVSQKKLEKAEAKLREKQEKRARDGVTNGENKYRKKTHLSNDVHFIHQSLEYKHD